MREIFPEMTEGFGLENGMVTPFVHLKHHLLSICHIRWCAFGVQKWSTRNIVRYVMRRATFCSGNIVRMWTLWINI